MDHASELFELALFERLLSEALGRNVAGDSRNAMATLISFVGDTPMTAAEHSEEILLHPFSKCPGLVNGRSTYEQVDHPDKLLWAATKRCGQQQWIVGQRSELGQKRGWMFVDDNSEEPAQISGQWQVQSHEGEWISAPGVSVQKLAEETAGQRSPSRNWPAGATTPSERSQRRGRATAGGGSDGSPSVIRDGRETSSSGKAGAATVEPAAAEATAEEAAARRVATWTRNGTATFVDLINTLSQFDAFLPVRVRADAPRTCAADRIAKKRAFRKASLALHPDRLVGSAVSHAQVALAEEIFKGLTAAYMRDGEQDVYV
jgi:hypothetical protein